MIVKNHITKVEYEIEYIEQTINIDTNLVSELTYRITNVKDEGETHLLHQDVLNEGLEEMLKRYGYFIAKTILRNENKIEINKNDLKRFDKMMIHEFNVSRKTRNCLYKSKIKTFKDLRKTSDEDLLKIKYFGQWCLQEVHNLLNNPYNYITDERK